MRVMKECVSLPVIDQAGFAVAAEIEGDDLLVLSRHRATDHGHTAQRLFAPSGIVAQLDRSSCLSRAAYRGIRLPNTPL
jgi:hypothetical protein